MRQVPLQCVHLHSQDRTDKYPDVVCTTTVVPKTLDSSSSSPKTNVNHYFHYRRRERLLPWCPWTTISTTVARTTTSTTTVAEQLLPLLPSTTRERLLPLRTGPLWKRTLRRYNPETPSVDRMHVLYEMHPMFAPCPFASCTFLLVRHADEPWEPGNRDHPTISSMFRTSARLLLHRYLHELPGPECCRGTIFVSPPWHPFCSAMVTKCFITCSCQHFHKIA